MTKAGDRLTATFQLPAKATLRVVSEAAMSWDATEEDLHRFGFVGRSDAYARFNSWLRSALGIDDTTESALNIIRYAVECAIMGYDHMPGSGGDDPEEDAEDIRIVRAIEAAAARVLAENEAARNSEGEA